MPYKCQPITDEMFLSDDEVEENISDRDGDSKALPQESLKVSAKGDLTLEEVLMDDSGVMDELQRENKGHKVVIKDYLKEKCDICDKKVEHLDTHIMETHKEEIQCQLCDQTFSMTNLRWHILKEHAHGPSKVKKCSLCDQKFDTKKSLKNHIREVHLSETFTCNICNNKYKHLDKHIKFAHDKNYDKNYECSYCKKRFHSKRLLSNHVQSIHLGEKTKCPDCKRNISVDNFRRHIKEFHERHKKSCPQCEKEFGMANLGRHIRQVHNNETTECPDCGKPLGISSLNKHIKMVHTKLKKTCDLCNENLSYAAFSVHKRRVHNIGKPVSDVTHRGPNLKLRGPRGPNLKLRKKNQDKIQRNKDWAKVEGGDGIDEVDIKEEGLENLKHEAAKDFRETVLGWQY